LFRDDRAAGAVESRHVTEVRSEFAFASPMRLDVMTPFALMSLLQFVVGRKKLMKMPHPERRRRGRD
jgi:hypothetical protein